MLVAADTNNNMIDKRWKTLNIDGIKNTTYRAVRKTSTLFCTPY